MNEKEKKEKTELITPIPRGSFLRKKVKYIVYIFNRTHEGFEFLKKKVINPSTKYLTIAENTTHAINTGRETFSKGLNKFFFVELSEGQIWLESDYKDKYPLLIDMTLKKHIIRQLTATLNAKLFSGNTIIMGIIGVVLGFFIAMFVLRFL